MNETRRRDHRRTRLALRKDWAHGAVIYWGCFTCNELYLNILINSYSLIEVVILYQHFYIEFGQSGFAICFTF